MFPWSGHITFDTQTILTIAVVVVLIISFACILRIIYDEPPDPEPPRPKAPDLPYAPPIPPHIKPGPRFAYIEAWKREQQGDQPLFPDVLMLGATPAAASAPVDQAEASPEAEPLEEEADWLNDRARSRASQAAAPRVTPAPDVQAQVVAEVQPEAEPDAVLEPLSAEAFDEAAEALPSLRPVPPGSLVELGWTADRVEAVERQTEEEEARPSLRPVSLDWIKDDLEEAEAAEEGEAAQVAALEPSLDMPALHAPDLAEASRAGDAAVPGSRVMAEPAPEAPAETAEAMPIALQAFGRAQLLVEGQPVESRANQRLELVLYLAHQAAQPGEERAFVDRLIISDELWPGLSREVPRQLERLRNCKSDLLDDVEQAGLSLEQHPWLETGPENALRLHRAVPNDLARFAALVEHIAQTRAQAEHGTQGVRLEQVETWQTQLQQVYQSGFAQQFHAKPWLDKARRHYQARFFQARFDLARLLACLGASRQAIDLGTETVLAANPSGDGMMRLLVSWVQQQEPIERETWANHFAEEYERRYGRTLARAHEKMETLRQTVLPGR